MTKIIDLAVAVALEEVSESAHSLATHGAQGHSLDSRHMDYTLAMCLQKLRDALSNADDTQTKYFDPNSLVWGAINEYE